MSEIINVDYNVHNLFPTPIHCLKVNDFETKKQSLIDYAYNLRDMQKEVEQHLIVEVFNL